MQKYFQNLKVLSKLHHFESKMFVVLFFLGFILRIWALNWHSIWFDEAFSVALGRLPLKQLIPAVLSDNNPPLYYVVLHFWMKLHFSAVWIRLPTLFFDQLALVTCIFVFKRYLYPLQRLFLVALYELSPLMVYISTEARPHGFAVFFLLLSVWAFLKFYSQQNKQNMILFLGISIVTFYVHFYAILVFLAQIFFLIIQKKRNWKRIISLIAIYFLGIFPWVYASSNYIHSPCACPPTMISLPAALVSPAIGGVGIVSMRQFVYLQPLLQILLIVSAIMFISLLIKGFLVSPRFFKIQLLVPLSILSIAGVFYPLFSPKAFVVFAPFLFFFVSKSIKPLRSSASAFLCIVLFCATSLVQLTNPFFAGPQIELMVKNSINKPDIPIVHTSLLTYYSFRAYLGKTESQYLITKNPLSTDTLKYIHGERSALPKVQTAWLIDTPQWVNQEEYRQIQEKIDEEYTKKTIMTITPVSIILLTRK